MAQDRQIRITIVRRGRESTLELACTRLSIGSGSHCDVRLLPDEAAERQLLLEPTANGMRVQSLARDPCCNYQGLSFDEIVVDDTARLELGAVTLQLTLCQPRDDERGQRGNTLKNARQVVMLVALVIGYYFALRTPEAESSLRVTVAPPQLFAESASASCPQPDPEAARAFAEEQYVLAESKRERFPFRIHDGVVAVPLYESAAACFRRANASEWADEALSAAAGLKRELADTLHTHRVRLDWFLGRNKYEAARSEVLVLRELLRGRDDAYSHWLASVERELNTAIAANQAEET